MTRPLGPRLQALADEVWAGLPVADVGADHALLPIALLRAGRVPAAVAVDRAPGPLLTLRALRVPGLEVRAGDGLAPLRPGEVGTVVIAGMGGDLIAALLDRAPAGVLGALRRLVLQPNTRADRARAALQRAGMRLVDEAFAVERGRAHLRLVAEPGPAAPLGDADLRWGPLLRARRDPTLRALIEAELARLPPGDRADALRIELRRWAD